MPIKVNGQTSGSVTVAAPATGSDVTLTLPGSTMDLGTELASKLPIAGGKILQIVRATDSTQRTTTSTTYVDITGMSVTITPQKSDSAVIIICCAYVETVGVVGSVQSFLRAQITDSSNNAISGAEEVIFGASAQVQNVYNGAVMFARATPATTSAVTYKLRFRVDSASASGRFNNNVATGQVYAIEVSA